MANLQASTSLQYWVGFNLIPGIGPAKLKRLLDAFGDLELAWRCSSAELARAGMDAKAVESIVYHRQKIDLTRQMEHIDRLGVDLLTWQDSRYPERLRHIYASPPLLYVRGSLTPEDDWSVSVVGTRRASVYGRQCTEQIVAELARSRVTIVSGMARGIDSYAHKTCLQAGGRTIAVLGCGVDVVYPPENARLMAEIIERGAVVSDYAIGTGPDGVNFPTRNRIISGLSLGTLVIEAGETSGALLTAAFALDQGREVFAIPGRILDRTSKGTNRLIQQGAAKLVYCAQDVLEELNLSMVPQQLEMREILPENRTEEVLLGLLSTDPVHVDEMCRASGLPVAEVSSTLAMMELKGMVRQVGGMNYIAARPV